jgi:glycosyltransferase involved in cell wall biosynthesis
MNSQAGPAHCEAGRKQVGVRLGGSPLSRDRTKLSDPPGVLHMDEIRSNALRDPRPVMEGRPGRHLRTAFIGTYPPRQCGIATFTHDLAAAVTMPTIDGQRAESMPGASRRIVVAADVVAIDYEARAFPTEVRRRLDPDRGADYLSVADGLNRSHYDVVSLQHEFGIYGGRDGERVLDLLDELAVPVVATLHTVLRHPGDNQRRVLRDVARAAAKVVVFSHGAADTLASVYGVDPATIRVIPHGVPDLPFVDPETAKPLVGLAGRPTILSFGLLGPGKGFELAIRAMSSVVRRAANATYIILGATHPELRRHEGEAYRDSLAALVTELGLEQHVRFVDAYVDLPTLGRWLQAADVFVTPYPGAEQAVSGTLAFALGIGKAIVSTPYDYAQEVLAEGRGRLVPFGDSDALGDQIGDLLADSSGRDEARQRAYAYGRRMTWASVGGQYRELFARVATDSLPTADDTPAASLDLRLGSRDREASSLG